MGKLQANSDILNIEPPQRLSRQSKFFAVMLATFLFGAFVLHDQFNMLWNLVPMSSLSTSPVALRWFECPDVPTFQCAYLNVPLDYANPILDENVSVFIRKYPATSPAENQLGSLFVNPGGPGSSGNAFLISSGERISAIIDGRYDIISWDPRGVNMTTPPLGCYTSDSSSAHLQLAQQRQGIPYEARGPSSLPPNSRDAAEMMHLRKLDAYMRAATLACARNGNQRILRASSTAFVVRDMVSILGALGEEERGLAYWGMSYGTILGATFAAMFPNLVHRMFLDAVSDAASYSTDIFEWGRSGMRDTHKTYAHFMEECVRAGPSICALANDTSNDGPAQDAVQLHGRLEALYEHLTYSPLPVTSPSSGFGVLTASDVKLVVFMKLYRPATWPRLAQGLADAEAGNGTILYEDAYGFFEDIRPSDPMDNAFKRHVEARGSYMSTLAIMCGDSTLGNFTYADEDMNLMAYRDFVHELDNMSPTGENWSLWMGFCRSWKYEAFETYRGPWTREEGLKRTKFPILFFSLTGDPVTPLSSARSMADGFGEDSATLLIQEGFGHGSSSHPSLCTAKAIRNYFLNGEVPDYGTMCYPEPGFIFPEPEAAGGGMWLSQVFEEDRELAKIWRDLSLTTQASHPIPFI